MFGNAAFKQDQPVFVGHQRLPAAMAVRAGNYSNSLQRDLGDASAGSEIIATDKAGAANARLRLGRARDPATRLAARTHRPRLIDLGRADANTLAIRSTVHATLARYGRQHHGLAASHAGAKAHSRAARDPRARPGERSVAGRARAGTTLPHFIGRRHPRRTHEDGDTIQQAIEAVGWSEKDHWLQFENFHRRNVTASYAELEWED